MTQYLGVDNSTNIAVSGVWNVDSIIPNNQTLVAMEGDCGIGYSWIESKWIAPIDTRTYSEKRKVKYDQLNQFEMQFDDQANGTTTWVDAINAIKAEFPKENN